MYALLIFLIVTNEETSALSTNIEQINGFTNVALCEQAGDHYMDSNIGSYYSNKQFLCLKLDEK